MLESSSWCYCILSQTTVIKDNSGNEDMGSSTSDLIQLALCRAFCFMQVVRRTGKLAYVWQGLDHLPELVERLQKQEETGEPVGDRRGNVPCASSDQNTHSLWNLSRKFIRLLLTHKASYQLITREKEALLVVGKFCPP